MSDIRETCLSLRGLTAWLARQSPIVSRRVLSSSSLISEPLYLCCYCYSYFLFSLCNLLWRAGFASNCQNGATCGWRSRHCRCGSRWPMLPSWCQPRPISLPRFSTRRPDSGWWRSPRQVRSWIPDQRQRMVHKTTNISENTPNTRDERRGSQGVEMQRCIYEVYPMYAGNIVLYV